MIYSEKLKSISRPDFWPEMFKVCIWLTEPYCLCYFIVNFQYIHLRFFFGGGGVKGLICMGIQPKKA